QAEDGIRDWSVTGVQTCALPISVRERIRERAARAWRLIAVEARDVTRRRREAARAVRALARKHALHRRPEQAVAAADDRVGVDQIGRASCREREEISGLAGELRK